MHWVAPEYPPPLVAMCHVYEYRGVPVDGMTLVRVSTWSASMIFDETVGLVAPVSWDATFAVAEAEEVEVAGLVGLSVIWSLKL